MSLFKEEVKQTLSMVEYDYYDGKVRIEYEELLSLIEGVCLGVIYKKDLVDEIYKHNN